MPFLFLLTSDPKPPTNLNFELGHVDIPVEWTAPTEGLYTGFEVSLAGAYYKDLPLGVTSTVIGGLVPDISYLVAISSVSEDVDVRRLSTPIFRTVDTCKSNISNISLTIFW